MPYYLNACKVGVLTNSGRCFFKCLVPFVNFVNSAHCEFVFQLFQEDLEAQQQKVNSLTHMVVVVDDNANDNATAELEEQLGILGERWSGVCKWTEERYGLFWNSGVQQVLMIFCAQVSIVDKITTRKDYIRNPMFLLTSLVSSPGIT